jgi:hypothetical protein
MVDDLCLCFVVPVLLAGSAVRVEAKCASRGIWTHRW